MVHWWQKDVVPQIQPHENQQAYNETTPTLPNPKKFTSTAPAIKVMFSVLFDIQDPCFQTLNEVMT